LSILLNSAILFSENDSFSNENLLQFFVSRPGHFVSEGFQVEWKPRARPAGWVHFSNNEWKWYWSVTFVVCT